MTVRGSTQTSPNDDDPNYAPNLWYNCQPYTVAAGSILFANFLALHPFQIRRRTSIAQLGARITTLAAGGLIQLGLYAANLNTNLPVGQVIARSGSLATDAAGLATSVGLVNAAGVALPAAGVPLERGLYWFAVNADATAGGTVIMQSYAPAIGLLGWLVGTAAQNNLSSAAAVAIFAKFFATTFGTWPDLTNATLTDTVSSAYAAGQFQVGPNG